MHKSKEIRKEAKNIERGKNLGNICYDDYVIWLLASWVLWLLCAPVFFCHIFGPIVP